MASLQLLYRQESAGGASRAAGKTLQLGKGRGVVLVLCEGKGRMPQAAQAAQTALATIEQQFAAADQQINLATTNVHASIVWINKDKVNAAGNGKVMCYNPQGGVHTLQQGIYNQDIVLLAPTAFYKALTAQQITEVLAANSTDLKAIYAAFDQLFNQLGEPTPTILMAMVTAGCPEMQPQAHKEDKHQQKDPQDAPSPTDTKYTRYWLIAAAIMTIASIVLLCLF